MQRELTRKSTKLLKKKNTKKIGTRKKTVFFQGHAIVIEEEISVDSNLSSSVYTSDDSFEIDNGVKANYADRIVAR